MVIFKIDDDGDLIWSKVLGDSSFGDLCSKIISDQDGNSLYFTGNTDGFGFNDKNLMFGKLDADGNLIWLKTTGEPFELRGESLI